jgi:hypothetical protein
MKAIDLLQRLQRNPDEAVIAYEGTPKNCAWIINRQGVVMHRANVDEPAAHLAARLPIQLVCVACQWPSKARIYRPISG